VVLIEMIVGEDGVYSWPALSSGFDHLSIIYGIETRLREGKGRTFSNRDTRAICSSPWFGKQTTRLGRGSQ